MLRRAMPAERHPPAASRLLPSLAWLRNDRGEGWRAAGVAGRLRCAAHVISEPARTGCASTALERFDEPERRLGRAGLTIDCEKAIAKHQAQSLAGAPA
jgi:hypothetical protein